MQAGYLFVKNDRVGGKRATPAYRPLTPPYVLLVYGGSPPGMGFLVHLEQIRKTDGFQIPIIQDVSYQRRVVGHMPGAVAPGVFTTTSCQTDIILYLPHLANSVLGGLPLIPNFGPYASP